MSLTKNGYLFCAAEKEDHTLNLILKDEKKVEPVFTDTQMAQNNLVEFDPKHGEQRLLEVTDSIEQWGPLTDLKVADLKDELEALIKDNKKYRCTGPSQEEINEVRNAESRVIYQL